MAKEAKRRNRVIIILGGSFLFLPRSAAALSLDPLVLIRSVGEQAPGLVNNWILYLIIAVIIIKGHLLRKRLALPFQWTAIRNILATTAAQTLLEAFVFLNLLTLFHPLITDLTGQGGPVTFLLTVLAVIPYTILLALPFFLLQLSLLIPDSGLKAITPYWKFGLLCGLVLPGILLVVLAVSLLIPLLSGGGEDTQPPPEELPRP